MGWDTFVIYLLYFVIHIIIFLGEEIAYRSFYFPLIDRKRTEAECHLCGFTEGGRISRPFAVCPDCQSSLSRLPVFSVQTASLLCPDCQSSLSRLPVFAGLAPLCFSSVPPPSPPSVPLPSLCLSLCYGEKKKPTSLSVSVCLSPCVCVCVCV